MMDKYRVHEVAKDLGVPNKDVLDLLEKYFPDEQRKHMTALGEKELNLVFEHYTQKNAKNNAESYFAQAREASAPKEATPAKPVEVAEKAPQAPAQAAPAAAKAPAQAAPVANKQAEKPAQPLMGYTKPLNNNQQRPQQGQNRPAQSNNQQGGAQRPQQNFNRPAQNSNQQGGAQRSQQNFNRPAQNNNQRPQQGQNRPAQNNNQRPQQGFAPQGNSAPASAATGDSNKVERPAMRHVDMRSSQVNLDKYNERYENIAPSNLTQKNQGPSKQKFGNRQQKGKPFRSKMEKEAEKLRRLELERDRRQKLEVQLPDELTVGELALRLKVQASEIIKRLMPMGIMASISQVIDYDTAALVAMEIGAKVEREVVVTIEERLFDETEDDDTNLTPRCPVVVVMGHVDHGKTSLLDAIRKTNVTSVEAGGITQHIGAYQVHINDSPITFLDTPGHAAFTSMRARGAQVTDIAVLVVAADDGIMPQTVEAINHAKAAGVSIIVAINKMDKENANPEKVKQELTEHELVPEEWGGDVICVPVSAKSRMGIEQLLEMILLVAETQELQANADRAAKGTVIEAKLDKGRGPVATVLVQNGTLRLGDMVIAGTALGRVRVMLNDLGERIEAAGPSTPVEITGLSEVPAAGDILNVVADERLAKELVDKRRYDAKEEQFSAYQKVTLDNLFSQISQGDMKELPIIVKADVDGSVEAVKQSLQKLSNDEVRVKVIHGAVGAISESDVMLANASNAIIVGFNVRPEPTAKVTAERDNVDMRLYRVIYDAINEVTDALKGMLDPKYREKDLGRAEVRQVMKISSVGTVSGCYVLDGKITRNALIRVVREGIIIADDKLSSLKRFKDDVKEVATGYECGMTLEKFVDVKEGDIFEAYEMEEYRD